MKHPHKILTALLALALTTTAHAKFRGPGPVPVDRLLTKAEAYLEKHKDEAEAYYALGRIHYLAFSLKGATIPSLDTGDPDGTRPMPAPEWAVDRAGREGQPAFTPPTDVQLIDHAEKAVKNFNEAIRLDPQNALYQLGLASLLEDFQKWSATLLQKESRALPPGLDHISFPQISDAYYKAFTLAMPQDGKLERLPIHGVQSITAYEAATAFVRLILELGSDKLDEYTNRKLAETKAAIAKFEHLSMGPITPIVFSFEPAAHLSELLDPVRIVDFDLRGYGLREQWSWVRPQLGLLVWDPAQGGEITSASQLFGSYTFQLFWKNGYAALAALDDNSDGQLTGAEMKGISVWFDKNGDGRSTPDEVTPVEKLGITAIAVNAESQDGIHPTNSKGITLRDGRTLRSWDWITSPQIPRTLAQK